jgi:hypothetical protein
VLLPCVFLLISFQPPDAPDARFRSSAADSLVRFTTPQPLAEKACIHAGPREPTAVNLAAFRSLCQQQKLGFHRFFTVFLGFSLFLMEFMRFLKSASAPILGKTLIQSGCRAIPE